MYGEDHLKDGHNYRDLVEHFVQNLKVFEQTIRKFGQKQETFCKITVSSVKITNSYLFI